MLILRFRSATRAEHGRGWEGKPNLFGVDLRACHFSFSPFNIFPQVQVQSANRFIISCVIVFFFRFFVCSVLVHPTQLSLFFSCLRVKLLSSKTSHHCLADEESKTVSVTDHTHGDWNGNFSHSKVKANVDNFFPNDHICRSVHHHHHHRH